VVKVNRFQQSAVAISLAVAAGALTAPALRAQGGPALPQIQGDYAFNATADCAHSASANCRRRPRSAPPVEIGGSAIRIQGDAGAMRLDARHMPIADVFAALKTTYGVSYDSWIVLDDDINGTYSGSLRRVIARLLDGYNYVIKQNDGKLDVTILERRGARAVPSAMLPSAPPKLVDPFHPLRERRRQKLLGNDRP
jgi:hypothetical protein